MDQKTVLKEFQGLLKKKQLEKVHWGIANSKCSHFWKFLHERLIPYGEEISGMI